jgi:hypothetical protein
MESIKNNLGLQIVYIILLVLILYDLYIYDIFIDGFWINDSNFMKENQIDELILHIDNCNANLIISKDDKIIENTKLNINRRVNYMEINNFIPFKDLLSSDFVEYNINVSSNNKNFLWNNKNLTLRVSIKHGIMNIYEIDKNDNITLYAKLYKDNEKNNILNQN